jgi:hypothetical protein
MFLLYLDPEFSRHIPWWIPMVSAALLDTFICSVFWGSKSAMLLISIIYYICIYSATSYLELGSYSAMCVILVYAHLMETIPLCDNTYKKGLQVKGAAWAAKKY